MKETRTRKNSGTYRVIRKMSQSTGSGVYPTIDPRDLVEPGMLNPSAAPGDSRDPLAFVKMHAGGNDFVIIDGRYGLPAEISLLARAMCDRHYGVGADGLVVLDNSTTGDFRMIFRNPDGSTSDMCGNALLCLARFVYKLGMCGPGKRKFDFEAGLRKISAHVIGGGERVRIDMGQPILDGAGIPTSEPGRHIGASLPVDGREIKCSAVGMGNPHCVLEVDELSDELVEDLGPKITSHEFFPEGTNVEFVKVLDRRNLQFRVWERGVGETLSCGSGVCAAAVAMMLEERVEREVRVATKGGEYEVSWNTGSDRVSLTGIADIVFTGECNLDQGVGRRLDDLAL
ncbi:MAG: diaminopimelate epimerase [Bdellovibrionales bacterium]|nr:diaminopimelate epimerase [Bdellovibrionales bacterium]